MRMLVLLMLTIFSIAAYADGSARYQERKSAAQAEAMRNTAATGYERLNVQESHGRKIVTGVMVNRMSTVGEGESSGNSLEFNNEGSVYVNVKMKNSGTVTANDSETSTASGNKISVQNANGVVRINADMENRGDVTAIGNSDANAAGNRIVVQGAGGNVSITGRAENSGAITANSGGH
ncbi:hypothetical protein PN36_00665 [Candidatus Thiomargarita nelsonii]|uniref:Secreted protein n=1 Tax=Candidatus Thiomargarita nelsonii TaxID=1003181 RepID=A0A0A6P4J8_9GAMM|nr:hypothetical protein PN36_00665 [Candidatus Thiomargarita nelsonii]